MDTPQWPQGIGVVKAVEKKARPQKEQAVNCPRCNSTNTKFCYYNNYSLSQPRYFCKTCRRYWTEGGTLRNVPVGGGSRKNKRSSSSCPNSSGLIISSKKDEIIPPDLTSPPSFSPQNPKIHPGHDLNLAYNPFLGFPFGLDQNPNSNSVLELLKNGNHINSLSSFMSDSSNSVFSIPVHDFKPSLGFSDQNIGYGSNNIQGVVVEDRDHTNNSSSRTLFPFQELKHTVSMANEEQDHSGETNNGYWMMAGGSW